MNGYSKVVYELAKQISQRPSDEVQLSIFGFQNYYDNPRHRKDLPANVHVYDALAHEDPKSTGFGINLVKQYIEEQSPSVVVLYNDLVVIKAFLETITKNFPAPRSFKIVTYIDQVYPYQHQHHMAAVNSMADAAFVFSKYWDECIKDLGLTIPTYVLEHGLNPTSYFPVPRAAARAYFGIGQDDFVILNINRNQPRKRWDICLKAFAEVVSRLPDAPIKLLVGTAPTGAWDLMGIYKRELHKRGVSEEVGIKHLVMLENPQQLSDDDVNILYNVADIGLTTCDGEGWGLCSFEGAAVGVPQIAPRLGGFLDFLDDGCATLVDPIVAYYVDSTRDAVGGEASICNYVDIVDAVLNYYDDPDLRKQHGHAAKQRVRTCERYKWSYLAATMIRKLQDVFNPPQPERSVPEPDVVDPELIAAAVAIADTDDIVSIRDGQVPDEEDVPHKAVKKTSKKNTDKKAKKTKRDKTKASGQNELDDIKKQLSALMNIVSNMK